MTAAQAFQKWCDETMHAHARAAREIFEAGFAAGQADRDEAVKHHVAPQPNEEGAS